MKFKINTKDMTYSALFTALISVMSYFAIKLPISDVKFTGQSLAIMLAGCVLTPVQAALSLITFLVLGAIGIPVFSNGTSGLGIIAGPSGGFLFGFLLGAVIISLIKGKNNSIIRFVVASVIGGMILVYIPGVIWYAHSAKISLSLAVAKGVIPFIPLDILKAVLAGVIGARINKSLKNF